MGILKRIKDDINYLVDKYNTRDPFELADALGIFVVKSPLKGGLNGCYHEKCGFQFIYINSDLNEQQQTMVAAHELGHARLHRGENILFLSNHSHVSRGKFERQANMYSAQLLICDNFFERYKDMEGCTVEDICQYECVSPELVDFKLQCLSK